MVLTTLPMSQAQHPLVSVLIPCHNYGHFLATAVNSALNQTHPHVEILVLDDASSDNTCQVAQSYGARIRYFPLPHGGQASTLNVGLEQSRGDYLVFLDADNWIAPQFIEKTLSLLITCNNPDMAFVYTARQLFGTRSDVVHPLSYDLSQLKLRNFIDMCVLAKRSDCLAVRFCMEKSVAAVLDYDLFLSLAEQNKHGLLLDEPLVHYRLHNQNMSRTTNRHYRQLKVMRAIIQRHPSLYSHTERCQALEAARDRIRLAIIDNRLPNHSLRTRIHDLGSMIAALPAFDQLWHQLQYTVTGLFKGGRCHSTGLEAKEGGGGYCK